MNFQLDAGFSTLASKIYQHIQKDAIAGREGIDRHEECPAARSHTVCVRRNEPMAMGFCSFSPLGIGKVND